MKKNWWKYFKLKCEWFVKKWMKTLKWDFDKIKCELKWL